MKLTVNIKEQSKIAAFLNLIKKFDYIELVDVKEDIGEPVPEHRDLLEKRLRRIEKDEVAFKTWELIKAKYEDKEV